MNDILHLEITKNPPDGVVAGPVSEDNFFEWEALIMYGFHHLILFDLICYFACFFKTFEKLFLCLFLLQ